MKEYLKKNGIRVGIIVGAVVLIIALGAAARGGKISFMQNVSGIVKAPMQKVLSSAVNWFDSLYGYLYDYDSLMAENESLRSQLADAQKSARDGIAASEENTRLRKLLELREKHTDYEMESAKVVLWSSSNWSSSFTISKGETSGIEIGDPVITEYGAVVGQITELGTNWATVSTLIDVDMSVGAFVGAAGNSGMVVGEYSFMKNKTADIRRGRCPDLGLRRRVPLRACDRHAHSRADRGRRADRIRHSRAAVRSGLARAGVHYQEL